MVTSPLIVLVNITVMRYDCFRHQLLNTPLESHIRLDLPNVSAGRADRRGRARADQYVASSGKVPKRSKWKDTEHFPLWSH